MYSNISQIFLLYKTWGYHNKFVSTKSLGVYYWCVKIPRYGYMWPGTFCHEKCSLKRWYQVFLMLKNLKIGTNKLQLDFKILPKLIFRRNNIHRVIDYWNRRRFGEKWHVTVPNSVTPIKPIVCKWIYIHRGDIVKWNTNYTYIKFSSAFS